MLPVAKDFDGNFEHALPSAPSKCGLELGADLGSTALIEIPQSAAAAAIRRPAGMGWGSGGTPTGHIH